MGMSIVKLYHAPAAELTPRELANLFRLRFELLRRYKMVQLVELPADPDGRRAWH